jgi:hypothetical protein
LLREGIAARRLVAFGALELLDLLEPGIQQVAHLSLTEDFVHRAQQHENAALHEQICGSPDKRDFLSTTTAELIAER